jgi:hypothetical protein
MGKDIRIFLAHHKAHVDVVGYKNVFFFLSPPAFQLLYVKFCNFSKNWDTNHNG